MLMLMLMLVLVIESEIGDQRSEDTRMSKGQGAWGRESDATTRPLDYGFTD